MDPYNLSTSWPAPPISTLRFDFSSSAGCSVAGAYMADDPDYINYTTVVDFLRSLVPLGRPDTSDPTTGDLMVWLDNWNDYSAYYGAKGNEIWESIVQQTTDILWRDCHREICPYLHLEGDPDLAGIGVSNETHLLWNDSPDLDFDTNERYQMMISYYFIAALATLYVIVFGLDRITALNKYSSWRRIRALLQNKLNLFLDTSLLFSIAMLLAAVYRFISHLRHPDGVDENTFFYSLTNAITISMFTVFPPLILQFLERNRPPKVIRSILWFLVIILAMLLTALYYKWRGLHPISKYFENNNNWRRVLNDHWKQALWLKFCDLNPVLLIRTLDRAILFAQGVLVLDVPLGIYRLFTTRSATHRGSNGAMSSIADFCGSVFRKFNIILCCGTMWLVLVIFTVISARVADGMGPDSKDRKLSVGQVLAVATFVPLIVEIVGMDIGDEEEDDRRIASRGNCSWSF